MQNIQIIKVQPEHIHLLKSIGVTTFYETFSADNSKENMNTYLEKSFSLKRLAGELADKNSAFYFAIVDNKQVGYLKLNFGISQTEIKEEKALEIERIYVLKAFQGKKIGQLLYEKALEIARNKKVLYVWLGVWENNHKAIRFYEKNGFTTFDKHIFKLGNDKQTDIMMKLQLE